MLYQSTEHQATKSSVYKAVSKSQSAAEHQRIMSGQLVCSHSFVDGDYQMGRSDEATANEAEGESLSDCPSSSHMVKASCLSPQLNDVRLLKLGSGGPRPRNSTSQCGRVKSST